MKIAQIIPYMHPSAGGPPVVVDRLSRELTALGHDVQVVTTDLYGRGATDWAAVTNRSYEVSVLPTSWPHGYAYSRRFAAAVRDAVRDADVVHIHTLWTYASLSGARACLSTGTPFLAMPHGMLDPHSMARGTFKKTLYGRLLEWPLIQRAQGICYTHPEEERLARQTCSPLPESHLIELGVEEPPAIARDELIENFFRRFPALRDRRLVLFLGRLHAKKGLDLLIPAFQTVAAAVPDAQLVLVGPGDEAYVNSLRQLIASCQLDERVTIAGPLYGAEKWGAMAASELFVLPSYQENFALAAVDALRSGLPVLLSRRVNLWQDIVDAGAGRVCELDAASIGGQIAGCLTDAGWRSSAVAAGQKLLETRFSWPRSAAKLAGIYESLLKGRSSSGLTGKT